MPRPREPIVPSMRAPPELEPSARLLTLPRSGRPLFFYDSGPRDAPGILLVHGLGDEADTWRRVIRPLSLRHRVVAPDLPGFGRSPSDPRARLSPPYLASVLIELAEHLELRALTLVGSSLGALVGQVAALGKPQLVSRLVLVDGGLLAMNRVRPAQLLVMIPGLGERRYRRLAGDLEAAYASLVPYYASLESLPEEEQRFLRARVGARVASATQMRAYFSSLRGAIAWMIAAGRRAGRRAAELPVPTLYVWGAQDRIVPLHAGTAAHARHPGSRLVVIPGAGHLPHQETPEKFLRVIAEEPSAASAAPP